MASSLEMSQPRLKELLAQELIAFKFCIQGLNPGSLNLGHLLLTGHSMLPLFIYKAHTHTHRGTHILTHVPLYIHASTHVHTGTWEHVDTFAYTETLTHTQT